MFNVLMHGIVLAFGLILPLGAQNVFVFQQGASQRSFWRALPVVITAAVCDTLLIILAVTGISVLVLANDWFKVVLMSSGVIFLVYMGWMTWKSRPAKIEDKAEAFSFKRQMVFAATISLLNPHAIIDTIGVIGTSSLQYSGTAKIVFSISCITVSWVWFASLAVAGRMLSRIDSSGKLMTFLNKISALIMWGIAIYLAKAIFPN
ncbi:LysE/ArgO family amino acid transporter [Peribacillus glennii]|uniref:Amino acid transporter n=1 Tax=Peribacillus glennii TaxID=2303991 RepID=A0A372L8D2_9BACI|nr:LysE/ArgO family amino acid transporter [Peribacillus glennii]RFU61627.1 amino acid transporter [Peribacillus glennii]